MRVAVAGKAEPAEGPSVTAVAAEWLRTAVGPVLAEVGTSVVDLPVVCSASRVLLMSEVGRKAVSAVARRRAAVPRTFVASFR